MRNETSKILFELNYILIIFSFFAVNVSKKNSFSDLCIDIHVLVDIKKLDKIGIMHEEKIKDTTLKVYKNAVAFTVYETFIKGL